MTTLATNVTGQLTEICVLATQEMARFYRPCAATGGRGGLDRGNPPGRSRCGAAIARIASTG
jgi:hypothetical protein